MPPLPPTTQENLWVNNCASECELWDICGGSPSAPCGCIWRTPSKIYKCNECHVICLARKSKGFSVREQLKEGLDLEKVKIDHSHSPTFPSFIPLGTHEASNPIESPVVGVAIRTLFNQARKKPVSAKAFLQTRATLESHLKIQPTTRVIGIMNSQDWQLEGFWGMGEARRRAFFELLKKAGFTLVTGPTFSVTYEESGYPASHNVFMLRRHHRVVDEIQAAGLIAAPNLYWRNELNIGQWRDWIKTQENLCFVARDFSLTKPKVAFARELEGLIRILEPLQRELHVFLVGVGKVNGLTALKELAKIGCTGSIVSSYPAKLAVSSGGALEVDAQGNLIQVVKRAVPKQALVDGNIKAMHQYVLKSLSENSDI